MDDAVAVLRVPRGARGRPAVESVATHSVHDVLAVELRGEGGAPLGHALFTGAGVRIDDTVHRALDERMGAGRALLFGPSFLVIALLVLAALGPLAEARIEGSAQQALTDARTRARRVAWLLVPVWGLIVTLGALALLGL
jgi:hypothetical protein